MKVPLYQIDAFTDRVFGGNPAAVCPLERWLPAEVMQNVALENQLSETAFFVAEGERYRLRWFTPKTEVELCGHATLASGYVILNHLNPSLERVAFDSRSGPLNVRRGKAGALVLDLPMSPLAPVRAEAVTAALGCRALETHRAGPDYLIVLADEAAVAAVQPDFRALAGVAPRGVIVTAPGAKVDFVSRFFGPAVGVDEDPVTGSAHCALTPYWATRLGKPTMRARQISARGGDLEVASADDRVLIAGHCAPYLEGVIEI